MKKYINKQSGRVIQWNPENGILIPTVWEEIKEVASTKEKEVVEEEPEDVQVYSSVRVLEAEADKEFPAATKAGNTYEYNGKKWVKTNG